MGPASVSQPSDGGCARPSPRGSPPETVLSLRLRVKIVHDALVSVCVTWCLYSLFWVCRSCCRGLCWIGIERLSVGTCPSGSQVVGSAPLSDRCFLGAVPVAGGCFGTLGIKLPQNDSLKARGGPWARHPSSSLPSLELKLCFVVEVCLRFVSVLNLRKNRWC